MLNSAILKHLKKVHQYVLSCLHDKDCHHDPLLINEMVNDSLELINESKPKFNSGELDLIMEDFSEVKRKFENKWNSNNSIRPKWNQTPLKLRKRKSLMELKILQQRIKKFGWSPDDSETLRILHERLKKYDLIGCDFEKFRIHFFGDDVPSEKIIWMGFGRDLARWFFLLRSAHLLRNNKHGFTKLLRSHFCQHDGSEFASSNLRSKPGLPLDDLGHENYINRTITLIRSGRLPEGF